jgi:hypothetical protein
MDKLSLLGIFDFSAKYAFLALSARLDIACENFPE